MRTSPEFRSRLVELEAKGLFRRVRTPGGARHFGQPIGTIIVADPVAGLARRLTRRATRADHRGSGPHKGRLRAKVPSKTPASTKKAKTTWSEEHGSHRASTSDGYSASFHQRKDSYTPISAYIARPRGEGYTYLTGESDPVKARKLVEAEFDRLRKTAPVRRPRDMESIYDFHDGTYGYDFQDDDTDWPEDAWKNPVLRREMANRESKNLGLRIGGLYSTRTHQYVDMNVETQEEINGIMRAYENMYPGFSKFLNAFELDPDLSRKRTVAYNRLTNVYDRELGDTRESTSIGLNPKYYNSSGFKKTYSEEVRALARSGWYSLSDLDKVAEEHDVEPWQAAMQKTMNHEIGHTIGRMIFGELRHPNIDREKYRSAFVEGFGNIMWNHGIIDDTAWEKLQGVNTGDIFTTADIRWGQSGNFPMMVNTPALRENLSTYGATNMHEIMAETWAAYMLDTQITDFVRELGTFMDELFQQWMEEAQS